MISSTLCAQEIVENQINENKEAMLRKNLLESESYEIAAKRDLNLETTNPIFITNESSLVLQPKAIPKNAFSYTQDCNFLNKPKPPLFPKPRDRQRINSCESTENDTANLTQNLHSDVKIDSKPLNDSTSCSIFNSQRSDSADSQISDCNNSSETKNNRLEDSLYNKLTDFETVPPPLPSRPPPVFKYPLGTFYNNTENWNTTDANDKKGFQKRRKSLQNEYGTKQKDRMICGENNSLDKEIRLIASPSEIQKHKPLLMTDLKLKLSKDNRRSFPPETNPVVVQKSSFSSSLETKKSQKPLSVSTVGSDANRYDKKIIPHKAYPSVLPKRSISIPLEIRGNKPPKPLPRPDLHFNSDNRNSSDNISEVFSKRSISVPLGIDKSQKLGSDFELNRNKNQQPKSIDSRPKRTEAKPIVPSKPRHLFHQRLEKILDEQRICEQECPVRRLGQSLEEILDEFSKSDGMDMSRSLPTAVGNISPDKKTSLDSSIESKTDSQSLISKSENSLSLKCENTWMDSSQPEEERQKQDKSDLNQDHAADFSVFHSLNRPTLPQKMKSTQRSLSYTSLVQTVKDIGATIWNPYDKSKRSSTGMISKVTEEMIKEQHSTPGHRRDSKSLEVKRSPKEEKAEIGRNAWYHDISATEAQQRLLKLDQDGAFLIRPTSRPTDNVQYTASITYAGRVFNIHIHRNNNYYYSLGKDGEKSFQRLSDLIKYYQEVPFDIHPAGSSNPHAICFRVTPPR